MVAVYSSVVPSCADRLVKLVLAASAGAPVQVVPSNNGCTKSLRSALT